MSGPAARSRTRRNSSRRGPRPPIKVSGRVRHQRDWPAAPRQHARGAVLDEHRTKLAPLQLRRRASSTARAGRPTGPAMPGRSAATSGRPKGGRPFSSGATP